MLTAVAGAVAEDFVAPSVEEVVATVDEAVNNLTGESSAKDKIMQKLQEKIAHTGDAMMSMKFSLSLNMDMMGQSQAIAIDATVNAISSGMKAVQIYGNAEMTAEGETQNALLDGYLMQEGVSSGEFHINYETGYLEFEWIWAKPWANSKMLRK